MDRPTFLDRRPLGIPNYLVIALVTVLLVAFIPRGARKALESNTNKVEDWLPAHYSESAELEWFRNQFGAESFVLVSWEGCTLGDTERLSLLAEKLETEPLPPFIARESGVAQHAERRLFSRVVTGPRMIEQLTDRPANLSRDQAIERLTGAFIGPPAVEGDDATRTTCLVAYLGPQARTNNRTMRAAIEHVTHIAHADCGIAREALHMGGPPVDNVAIDIEGERTLRTLAGLSGLVGMLLAYACFRSLKLTGLVLMVAVLSAGASLAIVYYFGAIEVLVMGADTPRLGKTDAILMSMPAVVYVLGLSGAIHMVNYYRDATKVGGRRGAVERAVGMALLPCGLAAFTTAIGLASLASSDILPIEKFGLFSAIGVLASLGLLFGLLPVALHRFAPPVEVPLAQDKHEGLPTWARGLAEFVCRRHGWVATGALALMIACAMGLPRIESSVKLIKLLDSEADLVQDYAWLEAHLGNLVPMEVIIAVSPELRRDVNEHPEASGQHYAMTTHERMNLARRIGERIEALEPVSRVLDAATFAPGEFETRSPSNRRTHDYIVSQALDENREALAEFLQWEDTGAGSAPNEARELWRASARIAALTDIDYGHFVQDIRQAVQPVLASYRQRNALVEMLAAKDKQLAGSLMYLVVPNRPTTGDALLDDLLREAGVGAVVDGRRGRLRTLTLNEVRNLPDEQRSQLAQLDAVVTTDSEVARQLQSLVDAELPLFDLSQALTEADEKLAAVYTGVMPLVYKTQRQLLVSLKESLVMASGLIALVLMVLLRSIGGGLASMIPNLFPIVVVFGSLGWFGIPVDIGIMMTASVALGVAVDDTIHFVSWFRRGLSVGLSRHDAAIEAYERCGTAMVQTTLIAGLGLAVFAFSTFTPTQQFGYLMITILAAALVGDLLLLPAMLVGPLGRLFPATGNVSSEIEELLPTADAEDSSGPDDGRPGDIEMDEREPNEPDAYPRSAAAPAETHPAPQEFVQPHQPSNPPHLQAPSPARSLDSSHEELSPAHAALRAKLRAFRRDSSDKT